MAQGNMSSLLLVVVLAGAVNAVPSLFGPSMYGMGGLGGGFGGFGPMGGFSYAGQSVKKGVGATSASAAYPNAMRSLHPDPTVLTGTQVIFDAGGHLLEGVSITIREGNSFGSIGSIGKGGKKDTLGPYAGFMGGMAGLGYGGYAGGLGGSYGGAFAGLGGYGGMGGFGGGGTGSRGLEAKLEVRLRSNTAPIHLFLVALEYVAPGIAGSPSQCLPENQGAVLSA